MESVSEFLFTLWVEQCVAVFGYELPINHIEFDCVGYIVPEGNDPLIDYDGEPTRSFKVRYDREVIINEQDYS